LHALFCKHCFKIRMTHTRVALLWLEQCGRQREFHYIYQPGYTSRSRGHTYLFHIEMKCKVFYWFIIIISEILLFIFVFVLYLGIKIHKVWDGSFKMLVFSPHWDGLKLLRKINIKNTNSKMVFALYIIYIYVSKLKYLN